MATGIWMEFCEFSALGSKEQFYNGEFCTAESDFVNCAFFFVSPLITDCDCQNMSPGLYQESPRGQALSKM